MSRKIEYILPKISKLFIYKGIETTQFPRWDLKLSERGIRKL